MLSSIQIAHEYLKSEYPRCISIPLLTFEGKLIPSDSAAIWQWQNADLKIEQRSADAAGAVIVDPQIGTCLFIQSYTRGKDIKAQLAIALRIRSELLPSRIAEQDADLKGEWNVILHWLAETADAKFLINDIASIREQTSHFEEVPIDIIINSTGDWESSIRSHGFPRLLLQTRAILQKQEYDKALKWASVETLVNERLRKLPVNIQPGRVRDYATSLVDQLSKQPTSQKSEISDGITSGAKVYALTKIEIRDFRNIDHLNLNLRTGDEPVTVNIVQGPNGAGKSSIFEAISIGVNSVSGRYIDFLNDPNEVNQGKPEKYIKQYLTPIKSPNAIPQIGINDSPLSPLILADTNEAPAKFSKLSEAIFSQPFSDSLLKTRSNELYAQIAASYSGTAGWIIDWVERGLSDSENARSQFNADWGIHKSITRNETARPRIVEVVLSNTLIVPRNVITWAMTSPKIENLKLTMPVLLERWQELTSKQSATIINTSQAPTKEKLETNIHIVLEQRNSISKEIADEVARAIAAKDKLLPDIDKKLADWSDWMNKERALPPVSETVIIERRATYDKLNAALNLSLKEGAVLNEQLIQLESVEKFMSQHWLENHPNNCPICNSDFSKEGGITAAIGVVKEQTKQSLDAKRREYQSVKEKMDIARKELSEAGAELSPIAPDDIERITSCLHSIFGSELSVERIIDRVFLSDILRCFDWFRRVPYVSINVLSQTELATQAKALSEKAWSAFIGFIEISEAPEAWKKLHTAVADVLTQAVQEHLPKTIQALWLELARNMMPAPWQYPLQPEFQVDQNRRQPAARIILRRENYSLLAAHILNGAEVSNLSLAWFLTKFLSSGRFTYSFLVLDDPAYQMDQPTFRDFCRLLSAIARLYKLMSRPLTILILLHQDERALDAAQATNGIMHLLKWNRGISALDSLRLRVPPILPRKPYSILEMADR